MFTEHVTAMDVIDKFLRGSKPYRNHPWTNVNEPDLILEHHERLMKSRVITLGRFRKHYRRTCRMRIKARSNA